MYLQKNSLSTISSMPIALYNSEQVYAIEQSWFDQGYNSFALMQQAAWQMSQLILKGFSQSYSHKLALNKKLAHFNNKLRNRSGQPSACIWVGQGNNGGDGWLIALYLQQAGWQVQVIIVDDKNCQQSKDVRVDAENSNADVISDAKKAKQLALVNDCAFMDYLESSDIANKVVKADLYIDALFGIGLNRAPKALYKRAITSFNEQAQADNALVVSIDIPSGVVASTGQVFDEIAIQADITLCLVARKVGLHTKDAMDYAGAVLDIPLIPIISGALSPAKTPAATLLASACTMPARKQNSHKGSYGHVLIIGGNQIDSSQGMGGAVILAAASAMAAGAGKITVACHQAFHGALLTSLPDAMTIDLHDQAGVRSLLKEASVVAIGMGLGRDDTAKDLFVSYLQAAMAQEKAIIIDADGLYHLASLQQDNHQLIMQLRQYGQQHRVCLTPHSGEAARLLEISIEQVENDRIAAIKQGADTYGGDWVLKGAGSLILEHQGEQWHHQNQHQNQQRQLYICAAGNAGMATAGMGDVLSGLTAGLLAQQDLTGERSSLRQSVLIHGMAADRLVDSSHSSTNSLGLVIAKRGLQAQDMPAAIRHIMAMLEQ